MAEFVPNYNVSYKGTFHKTGESFEIDDSDIEEMKQHGMIKTVLVKEEPLRRCRPPKK